MRWEGCTSCCCNTTITSCRSSHLLRFPSHTVTKSNNGGFLQSRAIYLGSLRFYTFQIPLDLLPSATKKLWHAYFFTSVVDYNQTARWKILAPFQHWTHKNDFMQYHRCYSLKRFSFHTYQSSILGWNFFLA